MSMHVAATDAPTVVEHLPAPHERQAISATAPVVVRYFPALQLLHVTEPTTALYFPAAQAVHSVFSPVYPRLHTQAVIAVCPVAACPEFAGQTWHTISDVAPV